VSHPMAALPEGDRGVATLPNPRFVAENRLHEDPDLLAIADCIQQAIGDAGLAYDTAQNDVGLCVTHESPGLGPHVQSFFRWRQLLSSWLRSRARFNPPEFLYEQQRESVYRLHAFLYVHYLSAVFGFHGFTLYNNNACASGAFALAVAADRIRNGDADTVVVAGGDIPEDGTKYRWFKDRGLYSPTGRCRPFSAERDGLVLGSGAAALVLQDLERARASGRRVYAEWLGGGFTSDGWKVTVPDVAGRRYARAIARALAAADVRPEDVTMISPHGVGASLLDRYEAEALAEVFGGGAWPALFPLKGAVGHTLGGCALVETIGALLALARGEIPAVAGVDGLDPALPLRRSSRAIEAGSFTLLKCVNGFGGQNGAVVLRSHSG
jgi:3-oxoacyl-[acyl-carrier-protein] synthase II